MLRPGRLLRTVILLTGLVCGLPLSGSKATAQKSGLSTDLAHVREEIREAEQEDAALAGGLVKTLIALRLAILRNSEAMLEQRRLANTHNIALTFSVQGEAYVPRPAKPAELVSIEQAIVEAQGDVKEARREDAKYAGGLVKAMAAARVATAENTLAMLKQRWYATKYGMAFLVQPGAVPRGSKKTGALGNSYASLRRC